MRESDIYRMDGAFDEMHSSSSSDEESVQEMHNDDVHQQQQLEETHHPVESNNNNTGNNNRPPPISTELSMEEAANIAGVEVVADADDSNNEPSHKNVRVSFNVPIDNNNNNQSSTMIHFQNPKRYTTTTTKISYPTQSLRRPQTSTPADIALHEVVNTSATTDHRIIGLQQHDNNITFKSPENNNYYNPSREIISPSLAAEVTPAFLRRAAADLGINTKQSSDKEMGKDVIVPPNSLLNRRNSNNNNNNNMGSSNSESSFYGADASALDGTFVSIRDLNDDDDVPSVDNGDGTDWISPSNNIIGGNNNHNLGRTKEGGSDTSSSFPTETTSLLGDKGSSKLPWQGGFFGSQIEKQDRKERRKMRYARNRGLITNVIWTIKSIFGTDKQQNNLYDYDNNNNGSSRGREQWEVNHPIGMSENNFTTHRHANNFITQRNAHTNHGGLARQRIFSLFLIGILCLHLALCGLHDLFLRYIAYRNSNNDDDDQVVSEVSWNGEGQYIPAYWMSFDGRVLNPLVGPGARTLTAFGALVPGLVLSKDGHGWRVFTSIFQTSSFVQLLLHIWTLKTAIGGTMTGLEWKRGTFIVASLYLISALIGSAWSIAVEPGRLITGSGMGIAGLLAASMVERACFPLEASKDDDDGDDANISSNNHHNGHYGNGSSTAGGVSSSSNEQFTFQPSNNNSQKKKRRKAPVNSSSPLLLLLELLTSWWGAYTSLPGTALAAMMGAACSLLLFVGRPPPGSDSFDSNANDLLFTDDTPPPPPPPLRYADDDDSADTSIGADIKHAYATPLMRRSILADEDDEEEPLGVRSTLRKRNVNGTSKTPTGFKGRMTLIKNKQSFSASRIIANVVGVLLCLLLTLIPASLIATGEGPSSEITRASVLGCKPMRILYKEDDGSDLFECAGGCIPLSRERIARRKEGMKSGRCDSIGYRCWQQSGAMTLRNYEADVGIYVVPSADGSCGNAADEGEQGYQNNDDANNVEASNGDVEGVQ